MAVQNRNLQLPIMLLDGQELTSAEHAFCRLRETGAIAISLRELLLYLRGAKGIAGNTCLLVVHVKDGQNLQPLLTLLKNFRMSVALASEEPLSAKQCDELLGMPYVTVLPVYPLQNVVYADATFCKTVDSAALRELRRNGVRLVITGADALHGEIPFGMDVLYAKPFSETELQAGKPDRRAQYGGTKLLPLDEQPLFSSLPLAIPLCILGTRQETLHHVLACGCWQTSYTPADDLYCTSVSFSALQSRRCAMPKYVCETFCDYLKDGSYIELRLKTHMRQLNDADRLLLYGFDQAFGTFVSKTSLSHGVFERVDILPQTLESICAQEGTAVILHSIADEHTACDTASFVNGLQNQKEPCEGVYYGREAAVRYANRFYKRFADGEESLSADSLRTFLEERRRFGFALWYLAKQEDLYLKPFENYVRLLADSCKRAIDDLRGKERLQPEMPLFLTSELMRNLLHTEEACVTFFLEEWERVEIRREHLRLIEQKKSVCENNRKFR